MRYIIGCALLLIGFASYGQTTITVVEKDSAQSTYSISDVSKITVDSLSSKFYIQGKSYDSYPTNNISKIHFTSVTKGCKDALAYNFNAFASVSDSCKYVTLNTKDSINNVLDTLASNPKDVCDSLDIKQVVESAQILSYFLFGQHVEITWELKQGGKSVLLKALYVMPNGIPNGPVLFVLHVKCKKAGGVGAKTLLSEVEYQSFGAVTTLGPTAVETKTNIHKTELTCFPNPVSDALTLKYSIADGVKIYSAEILNMNGSIVQVLDANKITGNGEQTISMNELPAGVYTVRLSTGTNVLFQKIIKL